MATGASAASPSSSSLSFFSSFSFTYDVFLSFRGEDTRFGFTGNLHYALTSKGIKTFIDDEDLGRGKEITASLVEAIEKSRIAIVVLSKNYAASSFCLDELSKIVECVKGKGRLIIPIFFDVDPSDVRKQTGSYVHQNRFNDAEKLMRWRMALKHVADLSGYHFKHGVALPCSRAKITKRHRLEGTTVSFNGLRQHTIDRNGVRELMDGYEHKFVANIVELVSLQVKRATLPTVDHPIGLDSQVENVISLLNVGSDYGVSVLGIHGIGGIGKTTLAVAVYNWIASHFADLSFECIYFHESIRENSDKHGLLHLQKILLSELVGENKVALTSVREGISMLKRRFQQKKVFLILDDVDQQEQLDALAGKLDWFSPGSRVIITTRDTSLLSRYENNIKYELDKLDDKEALELLSWKALKTNEVDHSHLEILRNVVTYASGLPLALEVIGSNFASKSMEQWKSALDQYRRIPNKKIQTVLKVSFDGLEEFEKEIFLDLACCFKGCEFTDVKRILCAHHNVLSLEYGLRVLVEKSLIKIDSYRVVSLHALIQDMGKEIVRQESPKKPGKRSRLWQLEDIVEVFEMNKGSDKIEMIHMEFPNFDKVIRWDGEAFGKMRSLKTLFIKKAHFSQGPKYLPNSLRVLNWDEYPSDSLPLDFHPEGLVIFQLSGCSLRSVRFLEKQYMNLTIINLERSNVEEIPDISGVQNLAELKLNNCVNLIKIHESVGFLEKIRLLSARDCRRLKRFPLIKLTNLAHLFLSGCSSLEHFPQMLGKVRSLLEIESEGSPIKELPSCVRNLTLFSSNSTRETYAVKFTSSRRIFMLPYPEILSFERSIGEEQAGRRSPSMAPSEARHFAYQQDDLFHESYPRVHTWLHNVESLDLSGHTFTVLHESIRELLSLRSLTLNDCKLLREIRGIPLTIKRLSARNCISLTSTSKNMLLNKELHEGGGKDFIVPGSSIPEWFEHHRSNKASVSFWFGNNLPEISLCVLVEPMADLLNSYICPEFIINGNKDQPEHIEWLETSHQLEDHIIIFEPKVIKSNSKVNEVISENGWNHVVCTIKPRNQRGPAIKGVGIYFVKNTKENIRFVDSPLQKEEVNMEDVQGMTSLDGTVNGGVIDSRNRKSVSMLDLNSKPCEADSFYDLPSEEDLDSDWDSSLDTHTSGEGADEPFRNHQVDMNQDDDDDVDMEEFYASLDAETDVVPFPPNEETREALKRVQDLITNNNDASVFLDAQHCSNMKTSLDYLSNLSSSDDGLSEGMRALVSEASRVFTHCSRDYVEASTKIESTASELMKAKELEADLEDNKNQFKEVLALEKELLQRQINTTNSNMTRKRKRDIFEEGKKLKTQMENLKKKVPHLQHEHDLAKQTQAKINVEWSHLREKFEKIVAE
ncbi:hypothetical protein PIB30_019007 [Stylosanthes scabra]|uniref:TIR domain-containing protein n=1 Tax=Stylosanthes scabra TaxID=79078 RepID=A0ABU6R8I4_9FABA|nr:hypothetical protein [Stylosanthes scabra]